MAKSEPLTPKRLRELLVLEDGVFRWRKTVSSWAVAGTVAGHARGSQVMIRIDGTLWATSVLQMMYRDEAFTASQQPQKRSWDEPRAPMPVWRKPPDLETPA
jgi:hypothetical protein